jgi:polyhydroxyalkanoate synthesis repressor PhaR
LQCNTPRDYGPAVAAILIKKYGNRRLYDTGDSRYITLDELAAKVRGGADIRVVDAQTNEDLTQATLTQIVLEASNAAKFLPVQLLTQMIRLSDDSLAEFFSRYVTGALDVYLQAKRGVGALTQFNPLAQLWNPFAQQQQQQQVYAQPQHGYSSAPPPPPPDDVAPPEPQAAAAANGEVASMRRELDELKQVILDGLANGSGKKKKKKS